jgi:alginate O-acetyltransferase complex protein AlgI
VQFNSLEFGLLLVITWLLFAVVVGRTRIGLLIVASFAFYASWNIPLVSLIVISAVTDYAIGLQLERTPDARRRKLLLCVSLFVNLGLLGFFKYAIFAIDSVRALVGSGASGDVLEILLPPGISFYTFQTMSYTIDVYRRRVEPTHSFGSFLLYVSFFPQLIAGPIERAGRLLPQIEAAASKRGVELVNLVEGSKLIIWGLFKKAVIADYLGTIADSVYGESPGRYDDWSYLVATYAFTLQIYCDFSAYSEIAKGSARLFGINLMWNFNRPYLSRSASEFWRRWHISLSEWFRDYVYIPLGGNRWGARRTLMNLTITMFLSGLWHGAAWNFVLWGLYHGVLLVIDNQLERLAPYIRLRTRLGAAWRPLSWLFFFHAIVFGWILFRVEQIGDAPQILLAMLRAPFSAEMPAPAQVTVLCLMFAFVAMTFVDRRFRLLDRIRSDAFLSVPFHAALVIVSLVLGSTGATRFIYFQF